MSHKYVDSGTFCGHNGEKMTSITPTGESGMNSVSEQAMPTAHAVACAQLPAPARGTRPWHTAQQPGGPRRPIAIHPPTATAATATAPKAAPQGPSRPSVQGKAWPGPAAGPVCTAARGNSLGLDRLGRGLSATGVGSHAPLGPVDRLFAIRGQCNYLNTVARVLGRSTTTPPWARQSLATLAFYNNNKNNKPLTDMKYRFSPFPPLLEDPLSMQNTDLQNKGFYLLICCNRLRASQ